MTAPQRPRRQHKGDRLINPGATHLEVAVDHALAPFDRAARAAEERWGVDRLPALVSPETARKYGYSIGRLNESIEANDAGQVAAWAAVCIRGIAIMEAEAEATGAEKLPPDYFEVEKDGRIFAILRDIADWPRVKKLRPGVVIFSALEAANALAASEQAIAMLDEVRRHFPKAEVEAVRTFTEDNLDEVFK